MLFFPFLRPNLCRGSLKKSRARDLREDSSMVAEDRLMMEQSGELGVMDILREN